MAAAVKYDLRLLSYFKVTLIYIIYIYFNFIVVL
jgi:hypothetical protein